MAQRLPICTIGHSTLSIDAFAERLRAGQVQRVIDIRAIPRSRTHPQFNQATLPDALAPFGIGYSHIAALGGRRRRSRDVPPEVNGFWDNASFHHYADYALHPAYQEGLAELREQGQRERVAIMCAEAVWWRCHRRIVADWLIAAGESVRHILPTRIDEARLNPGAHVGPQGIVTYPAPADAQ
ncbi:DUF488 domain-containing protein [Ottowia sp.]|uniref:DUF488 domain-containing protein n=1 Tax=Ottowia sp. TaxID=1898956 RepID=UPI002CE08357|nr:DUF488 domain-containing protein [Ottowia sp.]HOB67445.1 DUF488 domain-containing protein [Ottowia sp.]HPZ56321.1 DUF488 domain-containing protein [Ottowia sp.]HQD47564.1 DUF488 domain-containing protein [Ottowia sp.]